MTTSCIKNIFTNMYLRFKRFKVLVEIQIGLRFKFARDGKIHTWDTLVFNGKLLPLWKYNTMTTVLQYLYCFNKSKYVHNNNTFYISQVTYSSHCTFFWDTIVINYSVLFSICFFYLRKYLPVQKNFVGKLQNLTNYRNILRMGCFSLSETGHSEFFLQWNILLKYARKGE